MALNSLKEGQDYKKNKIQLEPHNFQNLYIYFSGVAPICRYESLNLKDSIVLPFSLDLPFS